MSSSSKTEQEYKPTIYYFLGGFDIYDREETLGEELYKYDPNSVLDREYLIKKYIIDRYSDSSYKEKYILVDILRSALEDDGYDFYAVLEEDHGGYFSFPWNIKDPRGFFEDILKIAKESWKDELYKASLEDPNSW